MKLSRTVIGWLVAGFVWSIFMGITFASMGLGALWPQINTIAGPFVCPRGQLQLETQSYTVSPVEGGQILTWYCVDQAHGIRTEINPFAINFAAGPFQGLAIFLVILVLWYIYSRAAQSADTPEANKRRQWMGTAFVILLVVGITALNVGPLLHGMTAPPAAVETLAPTTSPAEATFQTMIQGTPVSFSSTQQPLPSWNGIPIMPQAVSGQSTGPRQYTFDAQTDSGSIETYYEAQMKALGWGLEASPWLGLQFGKDKSRLYVALAPASDLKSWVVTLLLDP